MTDTSVSLLDRLKRAEPDGSDWGRLHQIYEPLIRRWLTRVPGLGDEAFDLAQEVLVVVARELPQFERRRVGSFRAWLRQITVNRSRNFVKRRIRQRHQRMGWGETEAFLDQLEDPAGNLAVEWDRQHDEYVFKKLLTAIRKDFAPTTWKAFRRFALDGESAAQVAAELEISENAVLLAKSRVLKKLRKEAEGLID